MKRKGWHLHYLQLDVFEWCCESEDISLLKTHSPVGFGILNLFGELFRHRDSRFIRWDMCGFSTSYKKPTALLTNMPNLSGLARTCTRDHQHAVLRGSESRWVGGELKRGTKASFAGEYPMSLCTTWASLVSETLGSSSHSSRASRSMAHGFKTALHEAVHCSHRKVCQHARGADKSSNTQKTDPTLTEATAYIREKGVVFGQHTNAEVQSLKQGKDKQVTFQSWPEQTGHSGAAQTGCFEGDTEDFRQIFTWDWAIQELAGFFTWQKSILPRCV